MSNGESHIKKQLDYLTNKLIDNIINTPDKEILKEVEEDHGDPAFEANRMREMIENCRTNRREQ